MTHKQYPIQDNNEMLVGNNVTVISPFLTEKEMCAILKISKNTLYRRVGSKQIKKVVVGGCVRYPIKENNLEKYL